MQSCGGSEASPPRCPRRQVQHPRVRRAMLQACTASPPPASSPMTPGCWPACWILRVKCSKMQRLPQHGREVCPVLRSVPGVRVGRVSILSSPAQSPGPGNGYMRRCGGVCRCAHARAGVRVPEETESRGGSWEGGREEEGESRKEGERKSSPTSCIARKSKPDQHRVLAFRSHPTAGLLVPKRTSFIPPASRVWVSINSRERFVSYPALAVT